MTANKRRIADPSSTWTLDLSGGSKHLPPPGEYPGIVCELNVSDASGDTARMITSFTAIGQSQPPLSSLSQRARNRNTPAAYPKACAS
jgi:hypothetical protein